MQLVVDVGNTETVVGLAPSTTEIVAHWRLSSSVPRTADEMTALIRAFLNGGMIDESEIVRGVVGSVVPSLNQVWSKTIRDITGAAVVAIGRGSDLPIRLDVEEPLSVGADRVVNTRQRTVGLAEASAPSPSWTPRHAGTGSPAT